MGISTEQKFEKIEEYASDFDEGEQLKRLSQEFIALLSLENEKPQYRTAQKEYEIFKAIIKFFEDLKRSYKDEEIIIPGVDKSIDDFLTLMIEKNRENTLVHQKIELIGKCLKNLDEIINDVDALKNIQFVEFIKQKELEIKTIDSPEKITDTVLKTLKDDEKSNRRKIEEYKKLCREININSDYIDNYYKKLLESEPDLKKFVEYTEKQIKDEIDSSEKDLADLIREHDGIVGELKYKRGEIEKLKQKRVHPFHNDAPEIAILNEKTRFLAQKFLTHYRNYLSDLKNQNPEKSSIETEKSKYYTELGKYFAKKTQSIIYNGVSQKIAYIDLIREEIITENGQKILFVDFAHNPQ